MTFYVNLIAIDYEQLPIIVTGLEEGVLYLTGQNVVGAAPPSDCVVKCEVDPAYWIRKDKKGENRLRPSPS